MLQVVPEIDRSQVSAAAATAAAAGGAGAEDVTPGLYPSVNTNKYLVVEYNAPRLPRRYLLPDTSTGAADAVSAASAVGGATVLTVDTTPLVPVPPNTTEPLPGLDALERPFPTPEELEAAEAATAGPAVNTNADGLLLAGNDTAGNDTASTESGTAGRRKLLQSTIVHDVLVVYTAAFASRVGGVEATNAMARENIARTNKAYSDSGVNVQLNLVGVRQVRQRWQAAHAAIAQHMQRPASSSNSSKLSGVLTAAPMLTATRSRSKAGATQVGTAAPLATCRPAGSPTFTTGATRWVHGRWCTNAPGVPASTCCHAVVHAVLEEPCC